MCPASSWLKLATRRGWIGTLLLTPDRCHCDAVTWPQQLGILDHSVWEQWLWCFMAAVSGTSPARTHTPRYTYMEARARKRCRSCTAQCPCALLAHRPLRNSEVPGDMPRHGLQLAMSCNACLRARRCAYQPDRGARLVSVCTVHQVLAHGRCVLPWGTSCKQRSTKITRAAHACMLQA